MKSLYGHKDALEMGDAAEERFKKAAIQQGFKIKSATFTQNTQEHWDYLIKKGDDTYRVEVKARKRRYRGALPQDEWIIVELKGKEKRGWLYGGMADLFAFEQSDRFLLITRADLIFVTEESVRFHKKAYSFNTEYGIYYRNGWEFDRIAMIERDILTPYLWGVWEIPGGNDAGEEQVRQTVR